eukprot:m.7119 g.7119  ORF g.7119 m.7119 type:complete len:290 (+) comp2711_c0_seq1:142-1011(+)
MMNELRVGKDGDCDGSNADDDRKQKLCLELSQVESIVVASQQRGEEDMSEDTKVMELRNVLERNPGLFLQRWGTCIDTSSLISIFGKLDDAIVKYYVKTIPLEREKQLSIARNRRFQKMQELLRQGDFFSESATKQRSPWLYDQYIGKFLSNAETMRRVNIEGEGLWSGHLLNQVMQKESNVRFQAEEDASRQMWKGCTSSSALSESVIEAEVFGVETREERERTKEEISTEEKEALKQEFLQLMKERFLRGDDTDFFDYSTVDSNPRYDDVAQMTQDAEDEWFDSGDW